MTRNSVPFHSKLYDILNESTKGIQGKASRRVVGWQRSHSEVWWLGEVVRELCPSHILVALIVAVLVIKRTMVANVPGLIAVTSECDPLEGKSCCGI